MTPDHPLVARYLEKLTQALSSLAPAERADVVREIGDHIADAAAAGKPLDQILTALGPADQLARAYEVELLLHPKTPPGKKASRTDRYLGLIGLIAIGSLPTFIVVVVLGSVGVSFALSGVAVFIAGIVDAAGALPTWVHSDVEPWVPIVLGPIISALGILALWGLVLYMRLMARLIRRVLPSGRAAAETGTT